MYSERPLILDRIISRLSGRQTATLFETPIQTLPPYLQRNEHGRTRWQQWEWEAMWQLRDSISFIRDTYDVRVKVGRNVTGDLPHVNFTRYIVPSIALDDVTILRRELAKYPPEFIKFCGITQLRIVEKLSTENPNYGEGRRDISGLASSRGPVYIATYGAETIHHELFHRADQRSGELNEKKDRKWKKLNRLSNPYLYSRYWDLTKKEREKLPIDGFSDAYGRVDVWEDRAEIAELLMSNPAEMIRRADSDEVVASKLKRIMIDLYRFSSGRMNDQYFNDLEDNKVKEGYWGSAA